METVTEAFEDLRSILDWAPDQLVALTILALAVVLALGAHAVGMVILRRALGWRPYLRTLLLETRTLTRAAVLLLFLGLALPAAPLGAGTAAALAKLFLLTFIALLGWAALTGVHTGSELYLRRFRMDVEDNLLARKHVTQVRIFRRTLDTLIVLVTIGAALMTFEPVRQYGVSLFASAGVAGLIVGLAARPVLSNIIAGIQLAMTQPIRIDDAILIEGEFGNIEEITATYVIVRLWDLRRMVVPLTYFIEKPFQNWTREGAALIGGVMLHLDYAAPIDAIRAKVKEIAEQSPLWNGKVAHVQVTEAREETIEVRILVSADSAPATFDLRCDMREKLIDFLQRRHPYALPRRRQQVVQGEIPLAPGDPRDRQADRPDERTVRAPESVPAR